MGIIMRFIIECFGHVGRDIIGWFGWRVEYVCEWGVFSHRYDSIDHMMGRPMHEKMTVAPPWAKSRIVRKESP